jgi:hypothetical protein
MTRLNILLVKWKAPMRGNHLLGQVIVVIRKVGSVHGRIPSSKKPIPHLSPAGVPELGFQILSMD